MFGIGMPEMLLILAIAIIVIGPNKLPDLAKSLGRALAEFKRATSELKDSLEIDSELKDIKATFNDMSDEIKDSIKADIDPKPENQNNDGESEKSEYQKESKETKSEDSKSDE